MVGSVKSLVQESKKTLRENRKRIEEIPEMITSPQQTTSDPGEQMKYLAELWRLRICFLSLTVGSGGIFKPYTSWNYPNQKKTKDKKNTSNSDHEK